MKRMKKLLAFLLATMLLLTMIPISASAEDDAFTIDYKKGTSDLDKHSLTVNLISPEGGTIASKTVPDYSGVIQTSTVTLLGDIAEKYDIAYSTHEGYPSLTSEKANVKKFTFLSTTGVDFTLNLHLCDARNYENGSVETFGTINYYGWEPSLLKILHDNDVENISKDTDIKSVKVNFVNKNGAFSSYTFADVGTGANNLPYHSTSISDADNMGSPSNFKSIVIEYDNTSKEIPVDKLLFVKTSGDTYNIESADKTESIIAFYYEPEAEATTWSLWDVRFVTTGKALGSEKMPDDPTYDKWGALYVFNCWQDAPDGGNVFYPYMEVSDDLVVYADKESSSIGGTEYRVINNDTQIIGRFVEIYNAMNTTNYSADAVDTDSVKMQVNGTNGFTNKEYWNNGWRLRGGNYYYRVVNSDLSRVDGERYNNSHVPHNEAKSVTIFATIKGDSAEVTIPIDENVPGALAFEGGSTGQDHYIDIVVNPDPNPPTKEDLEDDPETDDIEGMFEGVGAVKIDCTNTGVQHDDGLYGLLDGSYTGELKTLYDTKKGEAYFGYVITVRPNEYVEQYNKNYTDTPHELDPDDQGDETITLIYKDGKWVLASDTEAPVTYEVTCKDEQGGGGDEEPGEPEAEDIIKALGDGVIGVKCVNTPADHDKENYGGLEASNISEITKSDDVCTAKVTITEEEAAKYVTQYNESFDPVVEHHQSGTQTLTATVTLTLADDGKTWAYTDERPIITITVTCEDPDDPDDDDDEPDAPTYGELENLIDVKVECTNTLINPAHPNGEYELMQGTYDVVKGSTGSTCTVTIRAGDYIVEYEKDTNNVAHGLTNATETGSVEVDLVYEGNGWKLANSSTPTTTITFEVKCGSTIVEVPGEGERYPVYVEPEDPTDPDQTGVSELLETDDHIQYLFGYPDDSFGPDRNMTRAEAAQMFYNLLKNQNVDAKPAFDDVPEGAWYATPVNVMAGLGIVDGVGDDKFEPNREITRAEFTTMAMRFADVPSGGVNIFTDVAPSDWFYSYVVNSIQYGWIEGYGDGTFRPDRLITRAEVTTIVNRMLDRQADMAFVIQNRDKLNQFTDLTTEHWAYYTIVEATNEHDYTKPAIGEDWTSLKK